MDADLRATIGKALGGDQAAFEELIRMYGRIVYAHAYGILRDREEAEDVAQETFLKAYKSRWRVREPEKFPQWLFAIARNRALDIARRRKPVPLHDEGAEIADDGVARPEQQLDGAELRGKIHFVLSALPESHRTAVTLRYLEGMDYRAIERTMGLSNGALRGILGRAMMTMRSELKNEKLEMRN